MTRTTSSSPVIQFQMSTPWNGVQKYIPTTSSTICIMHPCTGPGARRHSTGLLAAGCGKTAPLLSLLKCTRISAAASGEPAAAEPLTTTGPPSALRCSRSTMRSCAGSSAKSLIRTPRSSTTRRVSPLTLLGNHEATRLRAAPYSSSALANRPPTSSYAWQCPASATAARRPGCRARQAARRSSSRSRRAAVVGAGPPGGPSTSPSAASSMRYWSVREDPTSACSCLQT